MQRSRACAPNSGPRRFWRRSMRRISTAQRSSSMRRRAPSHCRPRNWRNCATRCIGGATNSRSRRLLKLVDTRLQQDHVIDPRNDSAVYYLDQAKQAGAAGAALQGADSGSAQALDCRWRHAAIQQRNFSDADRIRRRDARRRRHAGRHQWCCSAISIRRALSRFRKSPISRSIWSWRNRAWRKGN